VTGAGYRLVPRDAAVLGEIFGHRLLTADQLVRLGYFGSTIRCRARLRILEEAGLIERIRPGLIGSSQGLFRIRKQAALLVSDELGLELSIVRRQIGDDRSLLQIQHILRVTEFRIALQDHASRLNLEIESWLPEILCRHEYSTSRFGRWSKQIVKPDGYFTVPSSGELSACFVEIDLGHVSRERFAAKLRTYRDYAGGVFQETYEQPGFQVLVVTTGQRRLEHLLGLAEKERVDALFTTFEAVAESGPFAQIWRSDDQPQPHRLLSGVALP
jgi:hypothetical protein